ncbi:MAG: DUF4214 domain-containing protein [Hyphomonadaceae bacterium]
MVRTVRMAAFAGTLAAMSVALGACGDKGPVETVAPATGEQLSTFADDITDRTDRRSDAALYEFFCMNALGSACPEDIEARLAPFMSGRTRVDLADAFARLKSSLGKADPNGIVSDEDYVTAAYQVVLGRDPDPSGWKDNMEFVKDTGDRGAFIRSLLQSQEFRSK